MDGVIDSSMALAWALPDEASREAERFLSRILRKNNPEEWEEDFKRRRQR